MARGWLIPTALTIMIMMTTAVVSRWALSQGSAPSSWDAAPFRRAEPPGSGGGPSPSVSGPDEDETLIGGFGNAPRLPSSTFTPPEPPRVETGSAPRPSPFDTSASSAVSAPLYGALDLPDAKTETGAETDGGADVGMSLDQLIELFVRDNPDLRASAFEIPKAHADLLTAGLRVNPILTFQTQYIPYQRFSPDRPGGPTEYDVSLTHTLDLSGKRQARIAVAAQAVRVQEALYQDAVRQGIATLSLAHADVLAAKETLRFAQAGRDGLEQASKITETLFDKGEASRVDVNRVKGQRELAEIAVRDAEESLRLAKRSLGALLNWSGDDAENSEFSGLLRLPEAEPPLPASLWEIARQIRPDLAAYRLGVCRAVADVALAEANRHPNVTVTHLPYAFQDNSPFGGAKSATSWSLGVSVPLPVHNRNQGNIAKARLNVAQTQAELLALERRAENQVAQAAREFAAAVAAVRRFEADVLPKFQAAANDVYELFRKGEGTVLDYLNARKDYNEAVRQYRDALIRARRAGLRLNAAVGQRIVP